MDTQDKFERYMLNRMTENEKAEFENELETNPLLKEQLELEQDIVQQIRNRAFVERQIIAAKNKMKRGKKIRLVLYSVSSIAASLILFFFVHGFYQNREMNQLYATNFSSYANDYIATDGVSRGEVEIDSLILSAMATYEKKDYFLAETQFNQLLSAKDNSEIQFYLAITQLENGKTEIAINSLNGLLTQQVGFRYYEQSRWYLALAHLKLHHKTEAKKYLDELVVFEGAYWDKAKELLTSL